MADLNVLKEAVMEIQEERALSLTRQYLEEGADPLALFGAYQAALEEIGKRFAQQIYFIPELIMAGEMMKTASALIKPRLSEKGTESTKLGKILIATVEGDIHDIGKNIAAMMLEISGFDVRDIGVDVPVEKIISEAGAFNAHIIGLSGLLTLAFEPMKRVVEGLKAKGLRDKYKVIIGGGQMDEHARAFTGADAFATDAVAGVNLCKGWIQPGR
jgi:methylmalonyl-CoA mutase cobalamin-binding domain/chain